MQEGLPAGPGEVPQADGVKAAVLLAVCRSQEKGARKQPVASGLIREGFGLVEPGDPIEVK